MFVGAMTALVTPFRDGKLDGPALSRLVEAQIEGGIDAVIPCGTTGESPTLEFEEHVEVVRITVETARKRVPVIAGAGSNSTAHAIHLAKAAHAAGADGLLVVTPYYNKPTQDGLVRHYKAVADATPLPIIAYNVPGRTGVDMLPDAIARLCADEPRVVGVKEAAGSVARMQELVRRIGDRVAILSGDDALNLACYAVGGRGCISVTGNVAPRQVAEVWDAAAAGDFARAREVQLALSPLNEVLFIESNPIPVKAAAAMMGLCGTEIRPPLYPISGPAREKVRATLAELGLV
jgi:4-hydroxy-tetrahydrodipicolinate synthase